MNDSERLARAARFREETMTYVREENERMAREGARDCCEQCPHPKFERDEVVTLTNGVRLSVDVTHCQHPGPDCTALVTSHLLSESSVVANRMVEHLAAMPDLAAAGVTYMGCLAPDADRLILTYRVPVAEQVEAAVGTLRVEAFR